MRYAKRFSFGALLIGAIMALSSCDYVLEMFFPEFAENAGGAAIYVDVEIGSQTRAVAEADNAPLRISVIPKKELAGGGYLIDIANSLNRDFDNLDEYFVSATFSGLRRANYIVIIYVDQDGDGLPSDTEPGRVATHFSEFTYQESKDFDLRDNNVSELYSYMFLEYTNRIDPTILQAIQDGTLQELDFDPFFWIEGAPITYWGAPEDAYYRISFADPNASSRVQTAGWRVHHGGVVVLEDTGVSNPAFVDLSTIGSIPEGDWISLEVAVSYDNGHTEYGYYDISAIDEAFTGDPFDLYVTIGSSSFNLTGFPAYLDGSIDYDVRVKVVESNNAYEPTTVSRGAIIKENALADGYVENLPYGSVSGGYQFAPDLLLAQAVIDVNQNGTFGDAGDWESIFTPIILYYGATDAGVYFDPYDFFPIN